MKKIMIFVSLFILSACGNSQADVSVSSDISSEESNVTSEVSEVNTEQVDTNFYGDLAVDGTHVVDEEGDIVQLKGVSTHGINWFPDYVNLDLFTQIKETTNLNTFRIAMYTEDYNGYLNTDSSSQEQLLQLIDDAVSYAEKLDMYVIIDWHILSDGNPLDHTDEAIEFFTMMSEKYGDSDNVIFEICNEPNGETTWADIESYANQVIPAIRENSDNLIIVGTPNWSQDVDTVEKLDYDNIVYTLHFYAGTHKQDLRDKAETAINNDIPIFVSEFGISDASGDGAIDTESGDEWLSFLDDNQISYVMWNLANKDESSALINSDVTNTTNLTYDDLTGSGQWYYDHVKSNPTKSKETEETPAEEKETTSKNASADYNQELWEGGGKYTFTVNNDTDSTLSSYKLKVEFDSDIKVTDNWNGTPEVNGSTVTITPEDYNSTVESGSSTSDIGIIVEGDAAIKSVTVVS